MSNKPETQETAALMLKRVMQVARILAKSTRSNVAELPSPDTTTIQIKEQVLSDPSRMPSNLQARYR